MITYGSFKSAICKEAEHVWRKRHPRESLLRATSFVCENCGVCGIRKGGRIIVETKEVGDGK